MHSEGPVVLEVEVGLADVFELVNPGWAEAGCACCQTVEIALENRRRQVRAAAGDAVSLTPVGR